LELERLLNIKIVIQWVVLDNSTLSDSKIKQLNAIFFAENYSQTNRETIRDKDFSISNISTRTSFDKNENAWTTWLNLEISNSSNNRFSEYATTLDLPEGCWISDYYLYMHSAIIEKYFADFNMDFPKSELFYNLDSNGNLLTHSLLDKPKQVLASDSEIQLLHKVLKWTGKDNSVAYLPNDTLANVFVKDFDYELSEQEISGKSWNSALKMQRKWLSQVFEPQSSNEVWNSLVKYSFISEVMTPFTSYIVVENEAQKAMLQKKQKQSLAGNQALDLGENDLMSMSEPELLIFVFLLGIYWLIRKKKSFFVKSSH
jgi:hypothetical protein